MFLEGPPCISSGKRRRDLTGLYREAGRLSRPSLESPEKRPYAVENNPLPRHVGCAVLTTVSCEGMIKTLISIPARRY